MQKNKNKCRGGGGLGSGRGLGPVRGNWGQGGCEKKIEVNVKMQKCPGDGGPVGGPVGGGGSGWM